MPTPEWSKLGCDEVSHELRVPTGAISRVDLSTHLSNCSGCARDAQRQARLDETWAATRPPEPTDATWRRVWSQVEGATLAPRSQRSRWASMWAVAGVAQAAAVLLAAAIWVWSGPREVVPQGSPPVASTAVEYELEEGQTLFLVLDERGDRVVVKPRFVSTEDLVAFDGEAADPYANAFQMDLLVLNVMEGME